MCEKPHSDKLMLFVLYKYHKVREGVVKKHILTKPTRLSDLTFDELYDDISSDWRQKAARLQARRWRMIKRQMI